MADRAAPATVVVVAYGADHLRLDWLPDDAPVVVVHNDGRLDPGTLERAVTSLRPPTNVGFGAGVNLALAAVATPRIILCNPDADPSPAHWTLLADAPADAGLVAVPLQDDHGRPEISVEPYPTPLTLVLGAYRVGRWLPRGGRGRRLAARVLGAAGRAHVEATPPGRYPLADQWVTAALLSMPTDILRSVGGFDERFFMYYEDTDLCRRLADAHPGLAVTLAPGPPATHRVGGAAVSPRDRRRAERARIASARLVAGRSPGVGWRVAALALAPRAAWLARP